MSNLKIFHQCGHNSKWNFESLENDGVGDGFIISPFDIVQEKIDKIPIEIKNISVFDPQFYNPRSDKKKILTYEFYPNSTLNKEYTTMDYEEKAYENAYKCIEFQKNNNFSSIIIPCVYRENFDDSYLEIQKDLYILPSLNAIQKLEIDKPVYLTVVLKDIYLMDEKINNTILNFITEFQAIDGIYLVPEHMETYKRIRDDNYLFQLMKFIYKLRENQLLVHLGYVDIEGFLLSIADPTSISIGAYENTKRFTMKKFENADGKRQGPNPRIFSPKLLQNVEYTYLAPLKELYPNYQELFGENEYKIQMFEPSYNWHFTKPEVYKHYFMEYSKLLRELPNNYEERYKFILEKIKESMVYYKEIGDKVLFDYNSDGNHLSHWVNALNMFNNYLLNK